MTDQTSKEEDTGPVVVIAGGVGAARFLEGVLAIGPEGGVDPADVVAIVNVGDDLEIAGLRISPDLDTVTYTLAGLVNPETGWGVGGDSFTAIERLRALGGTDWFTLGDVDLGTHLFRTERLQAGASLTEATAEIVAASGLTCTILPATDGRLRTVVQTDAGELPFQEYFVQRRQSDVVHGICFDGAETVEPAPGVHQAITAARAVVIAPSNPFLSIGPVLAVPGLRDCLLTTQAPVVAVSPIVAGAAVKGPAAAIMQSLGHDVSALGVARLYGDLIDVFVLDRQDAALAEAVQQEVGVRCLATQTMMTGPAEKRALAAATLAAAADVRAATT